MHFCFSGKTSEKSTSAVSRITANDLTFVTVRDGMGHVISDASSVDVWNTQKGNVKSYPVRTNGSNVVLNNGGKEVAAYQQVCEDTFQCF